MPISSVDPHFKGLYESLSAYRNGSLAWQRVAEELSCDSFMCACARADAAFAQPDMTSPEIALGASL